MSRDLTPKQIEAEQALRDAARTLQDALAASEEASMEALGILSSDGFPSPPALGLAQTLRELIRDNVDGFAVSALLPVGFRYLSSLRENLELSIEQHRICVDELAAARDAVSLLLQDVGPGGQLRT